MSGKQDKKIVLTISVAFCLLALFSCQALAEVLIKVALSIGWAFSTQVAAALL